MERLDHLLQEAQQLNTKLRGSRNGLVGVNRNAGYGAAVGSVLRKKLSINPLSPSLITTPLRPLLSPEELVMSSSSLLAAVSSSPPSPSPISPHHHHKQPLTSETLNQLLKKGIDIPHQRSLLRSIDEKGITFSTPQPQGQTRGNCDAADSYESLISPGEEKETTTMTTTLSLNSTMEEFLQSMQEKVIFTSLQSIDSKLREAASTPIAGLTKTKKRRDPLRVDISTPAFKLYSSFIKEYNEERLERADKTDYLSSFLPKKVLSSNKDIDPSIADCWKLAEADAGITTSKANANTTSTASKVLEESFYEGLILSTIKASPRDTWLGGSIAATGLLPVGTGPKSPTPTDLIKAFCDLRLRRALQSGLHQELQVILPQTNFNSPQHQIQAPPSMLAWHLLRAGFYTDALEVLKRAAATAGSGAISNNITTILESIIAKKGPLGPDHPSRLSLQMEWTKETAAAAGSSSSSYECPSDPYLLALMRMCIGMDYRKIRANCLPPPLLPVANPTTGGDAGILGPIQGMDDWLWMHLWNCSSNATSSVAMATENLCSLQKSLLSQPPFTDSKVLLAKAFYFVGLKKEAIDVMLSDQKTSLDGVHLSILLKPTATAKATTINALLAQFVLQKKRQLTLEDIKIMFAYAFNLSDLSPTTFLATLRQLILLPTGATKTSLISYWVGEIDESGCRRDGYLARWAPLFKDHQNILSKETLLVSLADWCSSRRPLDAVKLYNLAQQYQSVIGVLHAELLQCCQCCLGTFSAKKRTIEDLLFWKESSFSVLEWYSSRCTIDLCGSAEGMIKSLKILISLADSIALYEQSNGGKCWQALEVLCSSGILPLRDEYHDVNEDGDHHHDVDHDNNNRMTTKTMMMDPLSSIAAEADLYTQQRPASPHLHLASLLPEVMLFTLNLLRLCFKEEQRRPDRIRQVLRRLLMFAGHLSGALRLPEEVFIQLRNVDSLLFF